MAAADHYDVIAFTQILGCYDEIDKKHPSISYLKRVLHTDYDQVLSPNFEQIITKKGLKSLLCSDIRINLLHMRCKPQLYLSPCDSNWVIHFDASIHTTQAFWDLFKNIVLDKYSMDDDAPPLFIFKRSDVYRSIVEEYKQSISNPYWRRDTKQMECMLKRLSDEGNNPEEIECVSNSIMAWNMHSKRTSDLQDRLWEFCKDMYQAQFALSVFAFANPKDVVVLPYSVYHTPKLMKKHGHISRIKSRAIKPIRARKTTGVAYDRDYVIPVKRYRGRGLRNKTLLYRQ